MALILPGDQSLIPISVLTGFLGSGKTTVLIPTCMAHDLRAHLRRPMVMMRHG
ncbi:MAG: GTP-binding protein [Novosphingobium sp.]